MRMQMITPTHIAFGSPHIQTHTLCSFTTTLRMVWRQGWLVKRRWRPWFCHSLVGQPFWSVSWMYNGDKRSHAELLWRETDNLRTRVGTELVQPFCLRDSLSPSGIQLDNYFLTTYYVFGTRGKSKAERTKCLPSWGSWSGRESRCCMRHLDNMSFKRLKGHRGGRRPSQGLCSWRITTSFLQRVTCRFPCGHCSVPTHPLPAAWWWQTVSALKASLVHLQESCMVGGARDDITLREVVNSLDFLLQNSHTASSMKDLIQDPRGCLKLWTILKSTCTWRIYPRHIYGKI